MRLGYGKATWVPALDLALAPTAAVIDDSVQMPAEILGASCGVSLTSEVYPQSKTS